jgi:hypothetical protein
MVIVLRKPQGKPNPANAENPHEISISLTFSGVGGPMRLRRIHRDA